MRGEAFAGVVEPHYGWAFSSQLASDITVAVVSCAHRLATDALAAGDTGACTDAARRGLLASPCELLLWDDVLSAAEQSGDPEALRRARRDAERALGRDGLAQLDASRALKDQRRGPGSPHRPTPEP